MAPFLFESNPYIYIKQALKAMRPQTCRKIHGVVQRNLKEKDIEFKLPPRGLTRKWYQQIKRHHKDLSKGNHKKELHGISEESVKNSKGFLCSGRGQLRTGSRAHFGCHCEFLIPLLHSITHTVRFESHITLLKAGKAVQARFKQIRSSRQTSTGVNSFSTWCHSISWPIW